MTSVSWTDPAHLDGRPAAKDEFAPDVAKAVAELRARHGLDNPDCHAAPDLGILDSLRAELKEAMPGVNRRGFLRLTGAAAVFALAACGKQKPDTLVPHAKQPDGSVLGKPRFYSTVVRDSGLPVAAVVKTYDGRPIKVDGNPDFAPAPGRADAATQAALVNLYDPDRSHGDLGDGPLQRDGATWKKIGWEALDAAVGAKVKEGGVAILSGPLGGPAHAALLADLAKAIPGLRHAVLDPRGGRDLIRPADAAVTVCIGSDLLADEDLAAQAGFATARRAGGQLIAVEATLSQTGIAADVRVRTGADDHGWVAWAIAQEVAKALGTDLPAGVAAALAARTVTLREIPGTAGSPVTWIAGRLVEAHKAGKPTLVYATDVAKGGDAAARVSAAEWLNALLGNVGRTVVPVAGPAGDSAAALLADCVAGKVRTLILWNANPAFHAGAEAALKAVPCVVALADRVDESAVHAHWYAPTLQGLESWGDADLGEGWLAVQQPCIQPLWNSRAAEESLMAFVPAAFPAPKVEVKPLLSVVSRAELWQSAAYGVTAWADRVKAAWTGAVRGAAGSLATGEAFWTAALGSGVVRTPAPSIRREPSPVVAPTAPGAPGLRLVLRPSRSVGDGTWLNNAWLQELPDPVSKVTWDNCLSVSPADAAQLGLADNDVVTVTVGPVSVKLPVRIQDGQHPGTLEAQLGWGRTRAGRVAALTVEDGFSIDCRPLVAHLAQPAVVAATGATYELACMQGHHRMEGRDLARSDVRALDVKDPSGAKRRKVHHHWQNGSDGKPGGRLSLWGTTHPTSGRKWGMVVDMDVCTGCNACITACSAENNVPVVGRDEVRRNREMHWMRLDRYYSSNEVDGKPDRLDVEVIQQPVMCQQCDNAPCEAVCPANATMHNDEGINIQVYNRCIGTRYCSNNCPYKVRRFNWYEYSKLRAGPIGTGQNTDIHKPLVRMVDNVVANLNTTAAVELAHAPLQLLFNPEVTVRSKGVMEKCNFCIQRHREQRYAEQAADRRLPTVVSACAQTCPTQAITFGDLNDPASEVSQAAAKANAYKLLDEATNTRPALSYLPRLRNRPVTAEEQKALDEVLSGGHAPAHGGAH
jgi:Fe-S-cluster-containing dehydrogenase component/anaerobic selenocysteine-containing dehydrogenase